MYSCRFFVCPRYRNIVSGVLLGNAGIYAAWQVLPHGLMDRHFTFSWQGVVRDQKYWTIWASHFSHCSLGHAISNASVFATLGYSMQKVMPASWLGVHLLCAPLLSSMSSLAAVYHWHGPESAKALCREHPGLEWNDFCHYRYLELRNGLQVLLTPTQCDFESLGIPQEVVAPPQDGGNGVNELVEHFAPYQKWYCESARGSLGMSAVALSLQGFGAAWLAHLGACGMINSVATVGIGVLLFQPVMDAASLLSQCANPAAHYDGIHHKQTDLVAHLVGFGTGLFLYVLRTRGLARLVQPPRFAAI